MPQMQLLDTKRALRKSSNNRPVTSTPTSLTSEIAIPYSRSASEDSNAIIIAGMASKADKLAPLALLGSYYPKRRVRYVDGGAVHGDGIWAAGPTEQTTRTLEHLETLPAGHTTIYSHSLGALAAIAVAEQAANVSVIALSPPLPNPHNLILHPRLLGRLSTTKRQQTYIPSFSYAQDGDIFDAAPEKPVPVTISETYAEDIYEHSKDFSERARNLCDRGILRFVVPSQDWNDQAIDHAKTFPGSVITPGIHSFQADKATMRLTAQTIVALSNR